MCVEKIKYPSEKKRGRIGWWRFPSFFHHGVENDRYSKMYSHRLIVTWEFGIIFKSMSIIGLRRVIKCTEKHLVDHHRH
jgi:hypothetical protein